MQNLSKNVAATITVVAIAAIVVLFASGPLVGNHAQASKYNQHHDHHHHHHHHHKYHNKYHKN